MSIRHLGIGCLVVLIATMRAGSQPKEDLLKLSSEEEALLKATNDAREKEKLPALKPNLKLFKAARGHTENMAKQGKLSHELDGKQLNDRVDAVGYRYSAIAENIAAGMPLSPAEAVELWLGSKGHRKNMLGKDYVEIGLGVAIDDKGSKYYTQVFGKPRTNR